MSSSLLARSHPPRSCLEKCFLSTFSLSLLGFREIYNSPSPPLLSHPGVGRSFRLGVGAMGCHRLCTLGSIQHRRGR